MTDHTRTQLEQICEHWHLLEATATTHYYPASSTRANLTNSHASPSHSPTASAAERLAPIRAIHTQLASLAAEWGHQPLDPPPHRYLLARWAWAKQHMPSSHIDHISKIHATMMRIIREHPLPTGLTCPSCGQQTLKETVERHHYCATCERISTPAETAALTHLKIATADIDTTPSHAAHLLGIPPQTVYSWMRRGKIDRHPDGTINTRQVRELASNTPLTTN